MLSDAETTASLSSVGGSGGRRRKALVICIDGCRADVLQVAAPGFVRDVLKVPGCSFTFHARCDDVPVSFPSWSSMWTGVGQAAHGIEDNAFLGRPAAPSVRRVGKTRPGMYLYPEILG